MNWKTTLLLCLGIFAVSGGILAVIFLTEPSAQREGATRQTAMLVDTIAVERATHRPVIEALGTVEAAREITLSPRVGGYVIELAEGFTPGGFIEEGEVLLRLDPADYEATLARRRAELQQAEADLRLEQGRQEIAAQDYALLDRDLGAENRSLVLREPQLQTAQATVESARAALRAAELNLERTTIRAPFDAHILTRTANLGSQVAPGEALAHLVGMETYWVVAAVPLSKLRFIDIPERPGEAGATAHLRQRAAWPEDVTRAGQVDRLLGELAEGTRMARVLVTVDDPLARGAGAGDAPPLILGAYVEARIEATPLEDVVRLSRDYLRKDDTVWVMEDGKLSIRTPGIAFRDARYAYLREGLESGDRVVTTNLSTVLEGAALRAEEEGRDGEQAPEDGEPGA
ncbi:MAG: efflux RND transporter periplasmic adaptor subunit [Opitutales bacterium]